MGPIGVKTAGRAAKNGRKTGRKSRGEQDGGQEGRKKTALFGCKTLADNGLCNKKSSFQTHEAGTRCIGPNKNIAPAGQKLRAAQQKPSDIRWERMVTENKESGVGEGALTGEQPRGANHGCCFAPISLHTS